MALTPKELAQELVKKCNTDSPTMLMKCELREITGKGQLRENYLKKLKKEALKLNYYTVDVLNEKDAIGFFPTELIGVRVRPKEEEVKDIWPEMLMGY